MKLLPEGWRRGFRIWRRAPAQEVDAELGFHLEERVADLVAQAIPAERARAQALREFGDVATVRAGLVAIDERMAHRQDRSDRWEWIGQDLRYVVRNLRRAPGFVIMVALTLALGLGANAAIFSLLDRLFLRTPSGIPQPDQVRRLSRSDHAKAPLAGKKSAEISHRSRFSYVEFRDLKAALADSAPLAGYTHDRGHLGRGSESIEIGVTYVMGDYFGTLGVRPALGRVFAPDEARIETVAPVAIIGNRLWQTQFHRRADIIGQTVVIEHQPYTVIGVAPADFYGPDNDVVDAWVPMSGIGRENGHPNWYVSPRTMFIRMLTRGRSAQQTDGLQRIASLSFTRSKFRPDTNATARLAPLSEAADPEEDASQVKIASRLAGVSAIILLIACANVANLMLARGMRRRREIAVRLALGVRRRRLIALLLMESLAVSLLGGLVALAVAMWGASALRHMLMPAVRWTQAAVDGRVLLFTVLLAVVTGLLAGSVPAWRTSRPDVAEILKGGARGGAFQRSRVRTGLLIVQAALAVVLLVGAGVFVRSLRSVETEALGYDARQLVVVDIAPDPDHPERSATVASRLPAIAAQLSAIPGVERVSLANRAPMNEISVQDVYLPGRDSAMHLNGFAPFVSRVPPEYFATVGLRIVSGRGFTSSDQRTDAPPVVVDERMARSFWPGASPIGQCVILDKRDSPCGRVVGVVSNAHTLHIIEPDFGHYYLPIAEPGQPLNGSTIILRTHVGAVAHVTATASRELQAAFAGEAEPHVTAMVDQFADEMRPWRTGAALFSIAGLLALLVAIVGIYSTISYTFGQRTHEIGVRMALGARASNVMRLVVGEGVRVVFVGVLVGVVLSLAGGRIVASMLYRTSPRDPAVLVSVATLLLLAAAAACLAPAWRALRIAPASALRAD